MSSKDNEHGQELQRGKKRRFERACDFCRRRRRRCDGSLKSGKLEECTACNHAGVDCSYVDKRHVDSLKARLERSEALVRNLRAQLVTNTSNTLSLCLSAENAEQSGISEDIEDPPMCRYIRRSALRSLAAPPPPLVPRTDVTDIEIGFQDLSIGAMSERFIGKSSSAHLIKAAVALKSTLQSEEGAEQSTPMHGSVHSSNREQLRYRELSWPSRRLEYWTRKPLETSAPHTPVYRFPSETCVAQLVELYFTHVNIYVPLLHRPTFQRSMADRLHLRDNGFAATVLLVSAIGSRWRADSSATRVDLACGWEWFDQVPLVGNRLFSQATLYDLQYYCLAAQFLDGSSAPEAWTLSLGLRLAQDIGCHQRVACVEGPYIEHELYKRAYWVLVYLDRTISWHMGRPCAVQYYDFDLDLPLECDDEYWEHPTAQPRDVPSTVAFFNALIRLQNILAFSLKILHGLKKTSRFFVTSDGWEKYARADLDSALDNWHAQIPVHLRWDPARADAVFFDQSVALHCAYYHLRIFLHRPLLRKNAPTALPSLEICTNAARACADMVDVQRRRKGRVPVVINMSAIFTSGIILLLEVWSARRTGLRSDSSRELALVHKCMEVLRVCENRWQSAGLLWDILAELASVGQLPLPDEARSCGPSTDSGQHSGIFRKETFHDWALKSQDPTCQRNSVLSRWRPCPRHATYRTTRSRRCIPPQRKPATKWGICSISSIKRGRICLRDLRWMIGESTCSISGTLRRGKDIGKGLNGRRNVCFVDEIH
ncbi:fungal-specific transcription factor domain-containing protein [Mycena polygramma]|nr:fungal-specific transcription factor domain-containing protein [Mycena polygramma]